MVSNRFRVVSWPVLVGALSAPMLMNCGGLPGGLPGVPALPGMPGNCPDMANLDAVAKFDWSKEFKLDVTAGAKLKGGVTAALELKDIAAQIDGDLKTACGGLAKDLGAGTEFKSGEEACKAAIKAMGDFRAKLGANAKIALSIDAPKCSASMDAYADCAGSCDASVKGPSAKVECKGGEISGTCDAQCSGSCELKAAAKCDGTCSGSCDATFSGTCSGSCDGKCDGKATAKGGASCAGKCEGKCDAGGKGSCGGKCGGSCELKAAAKCDGTCSGKCSAEFKAPKCSGEVQPPKMSADCKASCDAKVSGKLACTPAKVSLKIEGAADAQAAAKYKAALEANLPGVLKVAIGMKDRVEGVAGSVKGVVDGAQVAVKGAVSGGPMAAAALTACVAMPFKGAIDAAASIKASVNVSVDVKASASASGSAKAG